MRNKRRHFSNRRLDLGMPRVPFKDSNGATIKECRRKIPDRRLNNIQAEWTDEIVINQGRKANDGPTPKSEYSYPNMKQHPDTCGICSRIIPELEPATRMMMRYPSRSQSQNLVLVCIDCMPLPHIPISMCHGCNRPLRLLSGFTGPFCSERCLQRARRESDSADRHPPQVNQ